MRYQVQTALTPEEVFAQAMTYFGPKGTGLTLISQTSLGLVFQGGGGYVALSVRPGAEATLVELETRAWDSPVQQFIVRLSKRRYRWQRWWLQLWHRW